MIYKKIYYSLTGFNGSPRCDKTTPETFYNSYIERLQEILDDRHFKLSNFTHAPEKRLKEYSDAEFKLKYSKENKDRVLEVISKEFFY